MIDEELIYKIADANSTFTPGTPINQKELFAGRSEHVIRVIETITRPGQHAIMYGERGVGKTSLANVIHNFLPQAERFYSLKENCAESTTFTELWRSIFRQMQLRVTTKGFVPVNDEVNAVLLHYIDQDNPIEITPSDVRFIFSNLPHQNVILIIDEFDRVKDKKTVINFVDTIKTLSDYSLPITLVIVAVGDSVENLIKEHPSLSRALVQISLPRMSKIELRDIIETGLKRLGMTMMDEVKTAMVGLSQGLPHYTHLLALESVLKALESDRGHVQREDLELAIRAAIEKTRETTTSAYHAAITVPRGILHAEILLGCALAETDMRGYFSPADVARALSKLTSTDYKLARFTRHLSMFASERSGILTERGSKGRRKYRFADPMMQPFIIMKGLSEKKIPDTLLPEVYGT